MSDIFNVLAVLAFLLSLLACFSAARTAEAPRELRELLRHSPISRLKSLETSRAEMGDELQALANRVKMMRVRRATDHVRDDKPEETDPDPHREPDRWRDWMNGRLARDRLGLKHSRS